MTALSNATRQAWARPGIARWLALVAVLGIAFQIGHFIEHAAQFAAWLFGNRQAPWMSGAAMWLTDNLAHLFLPMPEICTDKPAFHARQMMIGMELLHLVGNSIFLVTIGSLGSAM